MSVGDYPLHVAAVNGRVAVLASLLEKMDINITDHHGATALITAVKGNRPRAVKLLLSKGADPNIPEYEDYPIHYAARIGNLLIFEMLLKYNADLNVRGEHGFHCIHVAAHYGKGNIVKYLVEEKKIDINLLDSFRRTPLHQAIRTKNTDIAEYLIEQIPDLHNTCFCNNNPLQIAAKYGQEHIVKFLINRNANVNQLECSGLAALHVAVENDRFEVIKILCEAGANILLPSRCGGMTPIHLAVKNGCTFILDHFLSKGAPINYQTRSGATMLHVAVECQKAEMVEFLISRGADVNITNRSNLTSLEIAVRLCNPTIIKTLLLNCAYFHIKDNEQCKLLQLLIDNNINDQTELARTNRLKSIEILIKYAIIRNHRLVLPIIPRHFPLKSMIEYYCAYCKQLMERLDLKEIGKTNITHYKVLSSMFDERQLAAYMNNDIVLEFCNNLKFNLNLKRPFHNIDKFLENGVMNGKTRQRFIKYVDALITEHITNKLPPEIRLKIINYMNVTDIPMVNHYRPRR